MVVDEKNRSANAKIEQVSMRYPWLVLRPNVAIVALMIVGLLVSAGSRAVNAGQGSPHAAFASSCSGTGTGQLCYEFETIDYKAGCNQITGINNFQVIVGAYRECPSTSGGTGSGGPYHSFAVAASNPTSSPTALPSYPTPFTAESDPSYPTTSTFLQGLNDGHVSPPFKDAYMVGYFQPSLSECKITCGVSQVNGSWSAIADPKQGSGPCAVTEVLAINDSYMGVGFYDTGDASPCPQQAFEYYPSNSTTSSDNTTTSGGLTYVDVNPSPPNGGPASSEATGINDLGDIVGTVTWATSSEKMVTSGWYYSDQQYYPLCVGAGCAIDTYPEGVNFSDSVVGYYVGSSAVYGFLLMNPKAAGSKQNYQEINDTAYGTNYTVVRALNESYYISGWTKGKGGELHGFVAACQSGCPGEGTGTVLRRRRPVRSSPKIAVSAKGKGIL